MKSNYFTQTLLPDYLQETGVDWNVVYDARGHFREPQTGISFGIGTLEVRKYLTDCREPSLVDCRDQPSESQSPRPERQFQCGVVHREGGLRSDPEGGEYRQRIRYRDHVDQGHVGHGGERAGRQDVLRVRHPARCWLHDFDKSGFSIAGTMQRDTRRYEFQNSITTIDLGLSLEDVKAMGLESEYQHYPKGDKDVMIANLRKNGASDDEIAFMFADFDRLRSIRRVELNAMTSPQFIAFIKRKLREHGIGKIVPDQSLLAKTHAMMEKERRFQAAAKPIVASIAKMKDAKAPKDLQRRVRKWLKEHPHERWDAAIRAIVAERAP